VADTVAHQEVRGPGGVEQEVGGKGRDARDLRTGQGGGVDEGHRGPCVERGEQLVLAFLPQVLADVVGQQDDAVGTQLVERPDRLGHRTVHVG
jgi:hypothetical protein